MAGPHYVTDKILPKQAEAILTVALTPDGKTLVTGGRDNKVKVWDVKSGQLLKTLEGHKDWVFAVTVTPDGKTLVSGSRDFTARVWDLGTGMYQREYKGHREAVHAVLITADGKKVVTGSEDGTVQVWDINSGTTLNNFKVPGGYVLSLAFTPNEKKLIVGNQSGAIIILNFQTGQIEREIKAHGPWVTGVCVTPDGKWVLSGSLEWKAFVHDITTGEKVRDFEGHYGPVHVVLLTPDGKYSFIGTSEKEVEIADMNAGRVIRKLSGHERTVSALALSKDESILVTGSEDGTSRIWRNDTKEWEQTGSQKINTILTAANEKIARRDAKAGDDFREALAVAREMKELEIQGQIEVKIKDFETLKRQFEKEEYEQRAQVQRKKEGEVIVLIKTAMERIKYKQGEEESFLKEFQSLQDQLKRARIHYEYKDAEVLFKVLTERIQEIQRVIIKRIVLTLGTKYSRLLMVEIAEKCEVSDVELARATVLEMIKQKEIAAEYFTSSQTVVFDQAANNDALNQFIKNLDAEFQGWSSSTDKKKG